MNIHSVTTRADHTDARRQAILDAALELFVERGFHGTAVPLVAKRAGCGAGTIYRYFASKEVLVNVLYRHWKQTLAHAVLSNMPWTAPPRSQFQALWQQLCQFARDYPRVMRFLELHYHGSYLDEDSRALTDQLVQQVQEVLIQAQTQQAVKDQPPAVLMAVVWGVLLGLLRMEWEGRLALSKSVIDSAEQLCWEAIRR